MIIHGKNVEIVVEENNLKLPILEKLKSIVLQKIINLLEKHPELVLSEDYRVHIRFFIDDSQPIQALYLDDISTVDDTYIKINLKRSFSIENIESTLAHELFHSLDRKMISKLKPIAQELKKLAEKEKATYSENSWLLFIFFMKLRIEGLGLFVGMLKRNRKITFNPRYIKGLSGDLEKLCIKFGQTAPIQINYLKSHHADRVGAMMVGVIVLHELFRQNLRFSAWLVFTVEPLDIVKFKYRKDLNADRIGDFFGWKNFELHFVDSDLIIYKRIGQLTSLDHIGFLKEYGVACNYLGIKEPFFTFEIYKNYKRQCWENYQRLKKTNGFKR